MSETSVLAWRDDFRAEASPSLSAVAPLFQPVPDPATVARPSVSENAVSSLVGRNLKRLRKQHRWSLEELSLHSAVSRAMLGQMEQGKSIPSIKTLWQVAQALNVSVSWFLQTHQDTAVLRVTPSEAEASVLMAGEGELRPLHVSSEGSRDEFYELRLAVSGQLSLLATQGTRRRVNATVTTGVLELVVSGVVHRVLPREALQFDGNEALTWRNAGVAEVQAFIVIKPFDRRRP
ncbi:MAG: XRE family transcriptional regulator [Rubrivivax sp.]|nr:MAG: XRE family transcriptional regulator [Rubrivivax sp.]